MIRNSFFIKNERVLREACSIINLPQGAFKKMNNGKKKIL